MPAAGPAGEPLYPPPNQTSYLTWEPDFAGLNNIRLQVTTRGGTHLACDFHW